MGAIAMGFLSHLGSVGFMICLVASLVFAWFSTLVAQLLGLLGLLTSRTVGGCSIIALQLGWNVAFWCCPWINTKESERYRGNWAKIREAQAEYVANPDSEDGNIVLLCNHTSFLDTPMYTRLVPTRVLWHCRGYVGAFLFKMPLFGTIIKGIGHFGVYFKSTEDGKFSVDKEKMAVVEERVDEHLKQQGVLTLFPEGTVNKDPEKGLLPFRYGTFVKALKHNFRLWAFTSDGHEKCW